MKSINLISAPSAEKSIGDKIYDMHNGQWVYLGRIIGKNFEQDKVMVLLRNGNKEIYDTSVMFRCGKCIKPVRKRFISKLFG